MIAHINIHQVNNGNIETAEVAQGDFDAEMQYYKDNAAYMRTPEKCVSTQDVEHQKLTQYTINIQFLNDSEREHLQEEIYAILKDRRAEGGAVTPPAYVEEVDYDAPNRETAQMYSLTYFVASKQDVEMLFNAVEAAGITVDNQDSVDIWRGIVARSGDAFSCVA